RAKGWTVVSKNNHDNQKDQDLEKINEEIEEELLQYLENGELSNEDGEEEQATNNKSFRAKFESIMILILVVVIITKLVLIIYNLLLIIRVYMHNLTQI